MPNNNTNPKEWHVNSIFNLRKGSMDDNQFKAQVRYVIDLVLHQERKRIEEGVIHKISDLQEPIKWREEHGCTVSQIEKVKYDGRLYQIDALSEVLQIINKTT